MTRARSRHTAAIDVTIASAAWRKALRTPAALCRRAADAALVLVPAKRKPSGRAVELAVVLTTDHAVRKLNAVYRGKDKPTDVLSFPVWTEEDAANTGHTMVTLGDVVIAYGVTAKDARAEGKRLSDHLCHLVVHGVLHLLGYDHMQDRDAATMERLEIAILKTLGIENPYAAHDAQVRNVARKPARKSNRPAA